MPDLVVIAVAVVHVNVPEHTTQQYRNEGIQLSHTAFFEKRLRKSLECTLGLCGISFPFPFVGPRSKITGGDWIGRSCCAYLILSPIRSRLPTDPYCSLATACRVE